MTVPALARSRVFDDLRRDLWQSLGASDDETDELLTYAANPLHAGRPPAHRYPLADAPCVAAWERYAAAAKELGAEAVLRRVLVQLRFPIQAGMSSDPAYRAATRLGILPDERSPGVAFELPRGLSLFLHSTAAGRVPVVLAWNRRDFERLVQAIARRNEPEPVPSSMGACLVSGYNNWDRIAAHRRAFAAEHPEDTRGEAWGRAFQALVPRTDLYQDCFILLSAGAYSSVPGRVVGLSDKEWRSASLHLRLEHECTHYVTRQAFGFMGKSLLDELVADTMGMIEALGRFQARAFLCFMGLEDHPLYREGGRLQNYRGTPPLSARAFALLSAAAVRAAETLESFDRFRAPAPLQLAEKAMLITAFYQVGLEGLASDAGLALLQAALRDASREPLRAHR